MLRMSTNATADTKGLAATIGRNIQLKRAERGMTQLELCMRVEGLSPSHLSRWENGHTMPLSDALVAVAFALECTLDDLVVEPAS